MIDEAPLTDSAQYYRLADELVRERLGGLHSARVLLASADFADIEQLQAGGRWDEAGELLANAAKGLEAEGAELLLVCTNTMHKVAEQVQAAIGLCHLRRIEARCTASSTTSFARACCARNHGGSTVM